MLMNDGGRSMTAAGINGGSVATMQSIIGGAIEIAIDAAQVAQIQAHLDEAESLLADARTSLTAIPSSVVGGSPTGKQLAFHSTLANQALENTIENMTANVLYYRDMIEAAVAKMLEADDDAAATATKGKGAAETGAGA